MEVGKEYRKKLKENLTSIGELLYKINNMDNARDKALVSFLYMTGCRIEEVVKFKRKVCFECGEKIKYVHTTKEGDIVKHYINWCHKCKKEVNHIWKVLGEPIKKFQIEFKENSMLITQVRSLKRGEWMPRNIPIPYIKEQEFINIFKNYIDTLEDGAVLFPFSRERAHQIVKKIGLHCHHFRHLRSTRLATEYGFNAADIKQHHGWSSSKPADTYVHLNWQYLEKKMLK